MKREKKKGKRRGAILASIKRKKKGKKGGTSIWTSLSGPVREGKRRNFGNDFDGARRGRKSDHRLVRRLPKKGKGIGSAFLRCGSSGRKKKGRGTAPLPPSRVCRKRELTIRSLAGARKGEGKEDEWLLNHLTSGKKDVNLRSFCRKGKKKKKGKKRRKLFP